MPPQISIPLDLPDVRVLQTEIDAKGDYIITGESTLERTPCRKCGREITQFHGHSDVCIKEAIGYKAVVGAVNRHISRTVEGFRMRPLHMVASTGNIKEPIFSFSPIRDDRAVAAYGASLYTKAAISGTSDMVRAFLKSALV